MRARGNPIYVRTPKVVVLTPAGAARHTTPTVAGVSSAHFARSASAEYVSDKAVHELCSDLVDALAAQFVIRSGSDSHIGSVQASQRRPLNIT